MSTPPPVDANPQGPSRVTRRGSVDGMLALIAAELLIVRREWIAAASVVVVAFVLGAAPHIGTVAFTARYQDALVEQDPDLAPPPLELGCADVKVPIAVEGSLAADLAAPFRVVPADDAPVIVRVIGDPPKEYEIAPIGYEYVGDARTVRGCLWETMRGRVDERFEALGVIERPGWIARADFLYGGGSGLPQMPFSGQGSAILSAAMLALLGIFTDVIPRARASGYLETLVVTPMRAWHLIGAWVGVGLIGVAFATTASLSTYTLLGLALGAPIGLEAPLLVVALAIPTLTLVALTPFVTLSDPRDAVLAGLPVAVGVAGTIGVAAALEMIVPGMGSLVPVGGVLAGLLGLVKVSGVGLGVAALTTVLLFGNAVFRLAGTDPSVGATDLGRRWAAGNHLPEVVLLFLLGTSGASAWVPAFLTSALPVVGMIEAQILLVALPAFVMTWPSQLPMRHLLGLRVPRLRGLLLTPIVGLSTIAACLVLWAGGAWLLEVGALAHDLRASAINGLGLPLSILTMAIVPAICEELLFRGALLSLLRRGTSAGAALTLQAAIFAVSQVLGFKALASFAIGLVLGILTIRTRSVLPAMYVRMTVNTVAVLMASQLEYALDLVPFGISILLVALAVCAPALAWWAGSPADDDHD